MTPYRDRAYLDLSYADGKTCVRCGRLGCEPCHYSGLYSDQLGKGGSQKAADLAADLCRECHVYFDLYEGGNDDARAAEFLLLILLTLLRNIDQGHVTLTVHTHPVQRQERPASGGRRQRPSKCTAAANQVKRPGGFLR